MTQNYLQAAKTCFQSSNVVEITLETAREFVSTSNNCTVNSSTNLNSIKSTVQSLNITRADPRVTHELFTMKLNSSKPQQPDTFVIEHQKEKSAILRRKFVIPYADVLGLQIDDRKIILDMYQRPHTFYKKKKMSLADRVRQHGQNTPKVPMRMGRMRRLDLKLTFTSQTKA